ncbi:helix-turn-helix transcriptional regulator [Nocardia noduli]|uniref:helix-turn-helix transcriptional regulator n=1 Tax=Nocardia noduli TaxID=2815722 RepID=UPI001C2462C9|nr:helix-turn-helix transcriptional regulator [Nocardia noduli]
MSDNQRAELAAFLRAHRAKLAPADVGLPPDLEPGRRRTPGLRREEVAEIAGVSHTWYTWLEQGRKIVASSQVVDALARALRLDAVEHRHLRTLAGLSDPTVERDVTEAISRMQRLADSMSPSLVVVHDSYFDFVVWNEAFRRIRTDPAELAPDRRNLLWWMFTDERNRAAMREWERAARAVLSQFRAVVGRRPDDARLAAIVAGVSEASAEFRTWWSEYPVRDFRPATIVIEHPEAGPIELALYQLRLVENPDLLLVAQLPATEADRARVAGQLDS